MPFYHHAALVCLCESPLLLTAGATVFYYVTLTISFVLGVMVVITAVVMSTVLVTASGSRALAYTWSTT